MSEFYTVNIGNRGNILKFDTATSAVHALFDGV